MALTETSSTWSYRSGAGLSGLFGLPFFLAGSFFFFIGLTTDEINQTSPNFLTRAGVCAFASIFIFVGLAIMGAFSKVFIDKENQLLIRSWGVFFTFKKTVLTLKEVLSVDLSKEVRTSHSKNGTRRYTVYPIKLHSEDDINIVELKKPFYARSISESLAKFLGCGMDDKTSPISRTRDADELDLSISEKLKRSGQSLFKPSVPEDMKDRVHYQSTHDGSGYVINMGSPSRQKPILLWVAILVFISLTFTIAFQVTIPEFKPSVFYFLDLIFDNAHFTTIIPLLICIYLLKVILNGSKTTRLFISPYLIIVYENILLFPKKIEFKRDELEEVLFHSASQKFKTAQLTLVSDHQQKDVCKYFPKSEVSFINDLILYEMNRA